MTIRASFLVSLVLLLLVASDVRSAPPEPRPEERTVAFTNVTVIPMDRERVLADQTVLVRGDRIAEIGDARRVAVPKGAVRVDGRGKYLLPGFVDMHTHLFSDSEFPDELAGDELAIMTANGVTTIRLMIGTPEHLVLRKRIAKGEMDGPTIYAASPQIAGRKFGTVFNGYVVTTPEEARKAVRESKAAGYDFIKLTIFISRPVYDAVVETAKEVGIPVIGHVGNEVGLHRALEARQQVEHLDTYLEAILADDAPMKESVSDIGVWRPKNWESLDHIDERKIEKVARETAESGTFTCPTMAFLKLSFGTGRSEEEIRSSPDYRFLPEKLREESWMPIRRYWSSPPSAEHRATYVRLRNRLIKAIHEAGGKIMAGSDSPEFFTLYGFALHREIHALADAGLSPYAALAAATRNPAEFLKGLDTFGTVERGKRADLVLLDRNPLEDIRNTERIAGVMVRGKWTARADLDKRLDAIAERFQRAFEDRRATRLQNRRTRDWQGRRSPFDGGLGTPAGRRRVAGGGAESAMTNIRNGKRNRREAGDNEAAPPGRSERCPGWSVVRVAHPT